MVYELSFAFAAVRQIVNPGLNNLHWKPQLKTGKPDLLPHLLIWAAKISNGSTHPCPEMKGYRLNRATHEGIGVLSDLLQFGV